MKENEFMVYFLGPLIGLNVILITVTVIILAKAV